MNANQIALAHALAAAISAEVQAGEYYFGSPESTSSERHANELKEHAEDLRKHLAAALDDALRPRRKAGSK